MAIGIPARMKRLEERCAQLAGRMRDVEDVQLAQLRKTDVLVARLEVLERMLVATTRVSKPKPKKG